MSELETDPARQAPPSSRPARFLAHRPDDLQRPPRWHRYAHVMRVLPASLERLAGDLGIRSDGRVLDYGCGDAPYRRFFPAEVDYVGADLPGNPQAMVELRADGTLPVEDESFDAVLSTQVLEHVADPGLYLAECFRTLRPGGRLLLSTHGIMIHHADPVDYWRWTSEGLRLTIEEAGFAIVRFEGVVGLAASGLQLLHDAIYWRLPRRVQPAFSLCMQSLVSVADRLESAASRRLNALVFALVAEKR
jgi:SAM-dependent methyltransferase